MDYFDDNLIAFFEPGVVYQWTKHTSSNKGDRISAAFEGKNVCFHIFSVTGRHINEFSNFKLGVGDEDEVLFAPGCEFLVCKKEIKDDITHIYIREIRTGLAQHVRLWVDDNLFEDVSYK